MNSQEMPNPAPVMQGLTAFWVSGALKAALELDLFTHIGQGKDRPDTLAAAARATPRGTRIVADAMCSLGYLEKHDGRYRLTPVADTFMRSDRPTFLAGFHRFALSEPFWNAFHRIGHAARTGENLFKDDAHAPNPEHWRTFAETTLPMALGTAQMGVPLVEATRPGLSILDVAAGSGGYGITLAQASAGSTVTFLDWPGVLDVTTRHARALGIDASRIRTIPGDALAVEWGGPYDVVIAGNFLHHFDGKTCIDIARRARAALKPDGVFATTEFVPDDQRKDPGLALLFAVAMLAWTDGGDAYTYPELESFLKEGGFRAVSKHAHPDMPSAFIVARP